MARSAGFWGDFFFHLNRLRLRVTLQLGQVRTIVSPSTNDRCHLLHRPLVLLPLLFHLLLLDLYLVPVLARIRHLARAGGTGGTVGQQHPLGRTVGGRNLEATTKRNRSLHTSPSSSTFFLDLFLLLVGLFTTIYPF